MTERIENIKDDEAVRKYKDEIEGAIVTLPFKISYVPKNLFTELDECCKRNFRDDRVLFITFLWEFFKRETSTKLIDDKVDLLTANIQLYLKDFEDRLSKLEEKPKQERFVFGARSKEKTR